MAKEIKSITIAGPAGLNYLTNANLAFANIKCVHRDGQQQYALLVMPTGLEANFYHDVSIGRVYWSIDRPFNFSELDETGAKIIEYVHILYTDGDLVDTPPLID